LRSWASNCPAVQSLAAKGNILDDHTETKALGILWNTNTDKLKYPQRNTTTTNSNLTTKREMLRESSKSYDPLGLLSPATIRPKVLMQELWQQGVEWDEPLPSELQAKCTELATELKSITDTEIPRCYFPSNDERPKDAELHMFVDASTKAYGAASYVTSPQSNHSSFMIAKTRVAPLKKG
jgi:hypothetical protein